MILAATLLALVATSVRAEPVEALSSFAPTEKSSPSTSSGRTDENPHQQARVLTLPDEAYAFVPASAGQRLPLLVLLHGADHRPAWMLRQFADEAERRGIVLLAPTSKGQTWDAVRSAEAPPSPDSPLANRTSHRFGRSRDSARVEAAISALEAQVPVDARHAVLSGFSDGATFALAMGMSRDYDFAAVIAWSPGIAIETERAASGRRVFVSHGRQDRVLSYDVECSAIIPMLRGEGASVTFLPFAGGHEMPEAVKRAFLDAAFGTPPGEAAHPLPNAVTSCRGATRSGM